MNCKKNDVEISQQSFYLSNHIKLHLPIRLPLQPTHVPFLILLDQFHPNNNTSTSIKNLPPPLFHRSFLPLLFLFQFLFAPLFISPIYLADSLKFLFATIINDGFSFRQYTEMGTFDYRNNDNNSFTEWKKKRVVH